MKLLATVCVIIGVGVFVYVGVNSDIDTERKQVHQRPIRATKSEQFPQFGEISTRARAGRPDMDAIKKASGQILTVADASNEVRRTDSWSCISELNWAERGRDGEEILFGLLPNLWINKPIVYQTLQKLEIADTLPPETSGRLRRAILHAAGLTVDAHFDVRKLQDLSDEDLAYFFQGASQGDPRKALGLFDDDLARHKRYQGMLRIVAVGLLSNDSISASEAFFQLPNGSVRDQFIAETFQWSLDKGDADYQLLRSYASSIENPKIRSELLGKIADVK
jgi:hypothetical protein